MLQDLYLKLIYLRKKSFFTKFFAQSTVKETKKYMGKLKQNGKTALFHFKTQWITESYL